VSEGLDGVDVLVDYTSHDAVRANTERLADVAAPCVDIPVEQTAGSVEARSATVAGTQIHSLRLPSFAVSTEIVFALPDERLVIGHDAGATATPYLAGTLLAVRHVTARTGLLRGLDTLLQNGAHWLSPRPHKIRRRGKVGGGVRRTRCGTPE
jgi:dihydrodipicolinate reductase